jgi:hypothetical protein
MFLRILVGHSVDVIPFDGVTFEQLHEAEGGHGTGENKLSGGKKTEQG